MEQLRRYYFETSALNAFAMGRCVPDAIATKAFQNVRGNGWYLSPTVLWEVLLTADEPKRERLLNFAQHLFEPDLIPSVEEILIRYLELGCPLREPEYSFVSQGLFAAPWRDICESRAKTLIVDRAALSSRSSVLRDVSQIFRQFIEVGVVAIRTSQSRERLQVSVQQLLDDFSVIPAEFRGDRGMRRHLQLVALFMLIILCAGVTIDSSVIEAFWARQKACCLQTRIQLAFTRFRELLYRGPFQQMAFMAELQGKGKFSRGAIFDCLHAVYCVYADVMLTADEHFRDFRQRLVLRYPPVGKIHHLDEVSITTSARHLDTSDRPI